MRAGTTMDRNEWEKRYVSARQLNPGLSPHTEQILLRCVQPDPMYRYQSADELLYDLNSNPGIPSSSSLVSVSLL